jgi:hypothetical protein
VSFGKRANVKLEPYLRVALGIDLPQHRLRVGDVATLVDLVPHPGQQGGGQPRGCVLKVFNAVGDSIAVVTVPESNVQPLHADEVLAVRLVAKAG